MASSKATESSYVKRKCETAAPFWHGIIQNAEFEFFFFFFYTHKMPVGQTESAQIAKSVMTLPLVGRVIPRP